MASFTTYNGGTYSNVIEVTASQHDSNSYHSGTNRWDINVSNASANIYFAKGVGPIQMDFNQVENHSYIIENGSISNYGKIVYSGSIARNGP